MPIASWTLLLILVLAPSRLWAVPGLLDSAGSEATLAYLHQLRRFEGLLPNQFQAQLWFDPYAGSDLSGNGSYWNPFRSFAEMKRRCVSRMRCSVKGAKRVFSPLTLTMAGSSHYQDGESLSWAGGTGKALAWDPATRTLVVATRSGDDPVLDTAIEGVDSGAVEGVSARSDTLGGVPSLQIAGFSASVARVLLPNHPYTQGQGPLRLFTNGELPDGLSTSADYFACNIDSDGFQLATAPGCASLATWSGSGSGNHMLVGASNLEVTASITAGCGDPDRICILFEAEAPELRVRIDANGYHPSGLLYSVAPAYWPGSVQAHYSVPIGGVFIVAGNGAGGWVGVQNIDVQNVALDAFSTQSGAGVQGKLVTLDSHAIEIRNGASDRSTGLEAAGHNSCFSSTGDGGSDAAGGILVALNAGDSNNDSGNALGSGACINAHEESSMRLIGTGSFSVDGIPGDVNCDGQPCASPVIVMPGGDLVIIGHDLLASELSHPVVLSAFSSSATTARTRQQFARVLAQLRNPSSANASVILLGGEGNQLTQVLREVIGRSESSSRSSFLTLCGFSNGGSATLSYAGLLVDDFDQWLSASDCGRAVDSDTNFTQTRVEWQGIYDDDDATNGSSEWFQRTTSYGSLSAFRLAAFAILASHGQPAASWSLMDSGSFDSGGPGSDGHAWGSPPDPGFRCQPDQSCWNAYLTPYTIDLTTPYGPNPEAACLPADVVGERICSLTLTPHHIGAWEVPALPAATLLELAGAAALLAAAALALRARDLAALVRATSK